MATLTEISEEIQRGDNGGIITDEDKHDEDYMEALVHESRAAAIFQQYRLKKRIESSWTQKYYPEFSKELQDESCLVKFLCPPVIAVDQQLDGFVYVGTIDGNCHFRKQVTRAQLANANKHRFTQTTKKINKYLYSDGFLELYGNLMIEEILADAIFENPADIPTYNKEIDNYPVDRNTINLMKQLVYNGEIALTRGRPIDTISDSQDTATTVQPGP